MFFGIHGCDFTFFTCSQVRLQIIEGIEMRGLAGARVIFFAVRPQFISFTFSNPQSVWLMMMNSCVSSR